MGAHSILCISFHSIPSFGVCPRLRLGTSLPPTHCTARLSNGLHATPRLATPIHVHTAHHHSDAPSPASLQQRYFLFAFFSVLFFFLFGWEMLSAICGTHDG